VNKNEGQSAAWGSGIHLNDINEAYMVREGVVNEEVMTKAK
jgi:hypothetical protein